MDKADLVKKILAGVLLAMLIIPTFATLLMYLF